MNTAFIYLGVVLIAQSAPLSVSELVGNPDRFNVQPVTVSGAMSNLRANVPRRGVRRYTFDLSDSSDTVHVISFSEPPCRSGPVTVEGIFEQVKRRINVSSPSSFAEITAQKVMCLPDRGQKARLGPLG
jgi:hypothetical protein